MKRDEVLAIVANHQEQFMTPITINLEPEDRTWLEQKAKQNQTTIAALISQAVKRLRVEETNSASFDLLLEQTRGIWKGSDALVYQQEIRKEW
jgi:hypothetical protein